MELDIPDALKPFKEMCRSCLENSGTVCLFDKEESVLLSDMLFACTSVSVLPGDPNPQQLCNICLFRLRDAFMFRNQCQRSEARLKDLNTLKSEATPQLFVSPEDVYYEVNTKDWQFPEGDIYDDDDDDESVLASLRKYKTENIDNAATVQENGVFDVKLDEDNIDLATLAVKEEEDFDSIVIHKKPSSKYPKVKRKKELRIKREKDLFKKPKLKKMKRERKEEKVMFTCETCGYSCKVRYHFVIHLRCHTGEKPFQCDQCERRFPSKSSLGSHIKNTHNTPVCDLCGKVYKHLKEHRLMHSGVKPHQCNMCAAAYHCRRSLKLHLRTHNKEARIRSHPCNICNKSFFSARDCSQHMQTHQANRQLHACSICHKSYVCKAGLAAHMKGHSGIKEFKCDHCSNVFLSKAAIRSHMITHIGKKDFECDECGKTFVHRYSLTTHKISHSKTKNYVCDICNQRFAHNSSLSDHKKKKHNIQSQWYIEPVYAVATQ